MGISVSRTGELEINDTKLDDALSNNYSDVVKMFSADTDDQSVASTAAAGLAGDINRIIDNVTSSNGYLVTQQKVLGDANAERQVELTELETRMERVEERYNRQFLAMQQIIDQMNSTRDSMESTFENLPFSNRD
jgi:flagellar hook-associated protein 2